MAKRARVHSRDFFPQVACPKGIINAARVQRFDWPVTIPSTNVDELGRKLHVGTTTDIPTATVTMEGFDFTYDPWALMAGYTQSTFPASGVSITDLKNVDVIGQIRDSSTKNIVNALYVARASVTGLDATFGVKSTSTMSYTFQSASKRELRYPVFYENFTIASGNASKTLSNTPVFLNHTSGYMLSAHKVAADGTNVYIDEYTDFDVTGTTVQFKGTGMAAGDTIFVTYMANVNTQFPALNDTDPSAIAGKYVPVQISVNSIPRVQSLTIRAAMTPEQIDEMGSLGKPVGYEAGIPSVTGDITVLKTDNDLINILTGQSSTSAETDLGNSALTTLSLKVSLLDPSNSKSTIATLYIPSISITSESDNTRVNQSMEETFGWTSSTGELILISGAGPY